jgi:MFS family permease
VRRDLTFYWWGQTTSAFGSMFTSIAIPIVAVVHLGASPGMVGLLSAASVLPVLLLGLPAGALADRITRPRRALTLLDVASALAAAAVAVGLARDVVTVGWLIALSAVQGVVSILAGSLYFTHLSVLVGKDGISRARARLQAGQYGAALVGRSLAGPAVAVLGGQTALAVDAASYLLSAAALLGMRSPDGVPGTGAEGERPAGGLLTGAAAGLRALFTQPFQRALMICVLSSAVGLTGITALAGPFLLRDIGLPTGAYGLVFALSGVMGLAGSAAAGRLLGPGREPRTVTVLCFAAGSCCVPLLPVASGPLPLAGGVLGDALGVRPALATLATLQLAVVALVAPPAVRAARRQTANEPEPAATAAASAP